MFVKRAKQERLGLAKPAQALETLRPLGLEAVRVIFGRAMERALRKLLESGKLATLPRKPLRRPPRRG